jgi:hypothetical protein
MRRVNNLARRRRYLPVKVGVVLVVALAAAIAAGANGVVTGAFAKGGTPDTCGYSGNSTSLPVTDRSLVKFNEIGIIEGFSVTSVSDVPKTVNTFYSDEHALTIGATGTTWVRTYVDPNPASPSITRIDDAGTNPAGVDSSGGSAPAITPTSLDTGAAATDLYGREVAPSLYLTDVTANASSKAGDWQNQSGANTTAQRPTYVGGTWKNNGAANPLGSDGKEAKNGADLGPHSETFVENIDTSQGIEGYGAEVRWDVATLDTDSGTAGLQTGAPGHTYRVQMMFHDGDHNADTGEACTTFTIPKANPAGTTTSAGGGQLQPDATDPTGLSASTYDTAHLTGGTANAGPDGITTGSGVLTFRLYKAVSGTGEAACRGGTLTTAPVRTTTKNVTTAVTTSNYQSDAVTVNEIGTYHWTVQYSGNTENNGFAETACDTASELVTVTKAPSKTVTTPHVKITEDVNITLTASASAGIKVGDTVTIKLFQGVCTTANHATGGTQFGSTVTKTLGAGDIGPNGEVNLGQLIYPDDFQPNAQALTSGTYWWYVSYNGNTQVDGSDDDCTETFSITLP